MLFAAALRDGQHVALNPAIKLLPDQGCRRRERRRSVRSCDDTDGNDGDTAKGIRGSRRIPGPGIRAGHTQADSDALEAPGRPHEADSLRAAVHQDMRRRAAVWREVFMGDLNISGEQAAIAVPGKEWAGDFMTLGNLLSDYAIDLWGRERCVGAPGVDPGYWRPCVIHRRNSGWTTCSRPRRGVSPRSMG
jgi:hypothetical protein